MPRIPVRESYGQAPDVPNVPVPRTDVPRQLPDSQAGEIMGAAVGRAGKSLERLGAVLAEHAIKRQEEEAEKQALDADGVYRASLLKIASDPKDGLTNRELEAAQGVSVEFDVQEAKSRKEILEGIKSPRAQALAAKMFDRTREPYYSNIVQHEARQTRAAYDKSNLSSVANTAEDMKLFTTPLELLDTHNNGVSKLENYLIKSGVPEETRNEKIREYSVKALSSALSLRVESDPAQAQAALDALRDQLDPVVVAEVEKTLDGKFTSMQATALWEGSAQQFRRPDGSYDTVAMREFVDGQPDMSQDKKDKIFSDLNGRASQNESNYKQAQANDQLAAQNDAVAMMKQGAKVEDIKKQIVGAHAAFGPKYQYDLERYIDGLFDTKRSRSFNDNSAYVVAYQKITSGEWSLDTLNDARDSLTQSHYDQLMRTYVNHINNPYLSLKQAHDEIDLLMDKHIGSNKYKKDERERFLNVLQESVNGRTDVTNDVYIQLAIEKLKQVKTGGKSWVFWGDKTAPAYTAEVTVPGSPEAKAKERIRAANAMLRSRGEKEIDPTPAAIKAVISRNPDWTKK